METAFIQEIYCISDVSFRGPTWTVPQEIGISRTNSPNNFMWEQLLSSPGSLPQGLSQQECEKQMEKLADQVRVEGGRFLGARDMTKVNAKDTNPQFWRFLGCYKFTLGPGIITFFYLPVEQLNGSHRSNNQALLNLPKSVGERIAKAPRRLLVQRSVQGQRLRRGLLRGTTIAFITTGYEGLGLENDWGTCGSAKFLNVRDFFRCSNDPCALHPCEASDSFMSNWVLQSLRLVVFF